MCLGADSALKDGELWQNLAALMWHYSSMMGPAHELYLCRAGDAEAAHFFGAQKKSGHGNHGRTNFARNRLVIQNELLQVIK